MNEFIEIPANKKSITMRKPIYGVGINDASYLTNPRYLTKRETCPYYIIWASMLERCYNQDYIKRNPTYIECTVCEEWKLFSNFKNWMIKQDWKGNELDKDLLIRGNKIYSPETCIFVSKKVNTLLTNNISKRDNHFPGITWHKASQKFIVQCSNGIKQEYLGIFLNKLDAILCYKAFKKKIILQLADEQENIRIKNALINVVNTEYV